MNKRFIKKVEWEMDENKVGMGLLIGLSFISGFGSAFNLFVAKLPEGYNQLFINPQFIGIGIIFAFCIIIYLHFENIKRKVYYLEVKK